MKKSPSILVLAMGALASMANADLIGWYPLETDGNDASGHGNHGVVSGNVSFPGGGNGFDGNDAASFGVGGAGGVIIPLEANPSTHPHLTVGMWVKVDASIVGTPGLYKTFGHDNGGWDRGFGLDHRTQAAPHDPTDFRWATFTGGAGPGPTNSTGTAVTTDWTFIAATWDALAGTVTFHADGNTATEPCNPTISTFENTAIGSLRPDNLAEPFAGLIDEVFVVDHAMSASEVQDIRTAGAQGIADLLAATPQRAPEFEYNFDSDTALSGMITGWTDLGDPGGGDGTAFNDQPANNVARHPALGPHSGANYIGTYEDPGDVGTDAPTGILESDTWVLAPFTRVDFAVGGGFLPFSGSPDAPAGNVSAFNIEREATPGVWEVIDSSTGFSTNPPHEGFREGVFDLRDFEGETARMRIYDTATGGWGHINVDTIQVSSAPTDDPSISVGPSALFGDLTSLGAGPDPVVQSLTVSNFGDTQDLVVSALNLTGDDAGLYQITPVGLPLTIGPGLNASVEITFAPPAAGGAFSAMLEIESNDAENPTRTVDLSATVTTDPNIELSGADPLFGFIVGPQPVTRTVTVANTGVAQNLDISDVRITGAGAGVFSLGALPAMITPGNGFVLEISFDDGGSPGTYDATLEIDSNDIDLGTAMFPISAISPPPPTLVAFYPFDNTGNPLKDASGVTGDAVVGGGAPVFDAAGGFDGGCYQFGGADWLTAPIDINPSVLPHVTFGAWVRADDITPGLRKVMGHDDGAWDRVIGLDDRTQAAGGPQPPTMRYSAFTGTNAHGPVQSTPEPANTTDYTFLAATYNETEATVSVFVDLDASTTADPLVKTTAPTVMGPSANTTLAVGAIRPDTGLEGWIGCIDNAFVFDGILTDEEIEDLRDRGTRAFFGADDFRITSIVRNPNHTITLTWNSRSSATYIVRFNNNLSDPVADWPDDADNIPSQGETTTHTTANMFDPATIPVLFLVVEEG